MTARILVIQHELDDPLGDLAGPLLDAGVDLVPWFAPGDDVPPAGLDDVDGVISLGANSGVQDEAKHSWMPVERELLQSALDRGVPVLGLCFGAQILAVAAGGRGWTMDTPEIGWCDVRLTEDGVADPVVGALGESLRAVQFHYDSFDLPPGATLLATNGPITQAYRVGDHAWGLQFHIEIGPSLLLTWAGAYAEEMGRVIDLDAMHAETKVYWQEYRAKGVALATAFAQVVQQYARGRVAPPR